MAFVPQLELVVRKHFSDNWALSIFVCTVAIFDFKRRGKMGRVVNTINEACIFKGVHKSLSSHSLLPQPRPQGAFPHLHLQSRDMSRIDLVSKNLLANVFRNCRKRNNWEKLCQKITNKYRKNRKNNKYNKNKDLAKKKSQEGPRNVRKSCKNRKVTRIFLANLKHPWQISQKWQK